MCGYCEAPRFAKEFGMAGVDRLSATVSGRFGDRLDARGDGVLSLGSRLSEWRDDRTGGDDLGETGLLVPADTTTEKLIEVGGLPQLGAVNYPGDSDWYAIELEEGETVRVSLVGVDWNPYGRTGELPAGELAIVDAEGNVLSLGESYAYEGYEAVSAVYTVETTGTYYVDIAGQGSTAMGGYMVIANEVVDGSPAAPGDGEESRDIAGDITTTRNVQVDQRRYETIDFEGDTDWFRVELTEGEIVRLGVIGSNHNVENGLGRLGQSVLRVYDEEGNPLAAGFDISDGNGLSGFFFKPPETGTYYIGVAGATDLYRGDYVLDVVSADGWLAEALSDPTTAGVLGGVAAEGQDTGSQQAGDLSTQVPLGPDTGPQLGSVDYGGDSDWYRMDLEAGETVRLTVFGFDWNPINAPEALLRAELTLRDGEGNALGGGESFSVAGLGATTLVYRAQEDGTYYVDVSGRTATQTGDYMVSVREVRDISPVSPEDFTEDKNIPGDATTRRTIEPDERKYASIDFDGDKDWFRIDMDAGETVRLGVLGMNHTYGNGMGRLSRSELRVLDENGVVVGSGDDISSGRGLTGLYFTASQSGSYYVEVAGEDGDETGDYVLDAVSVDRGLMGSVSGTATASLLTEAWAASEAGTGLLIPGDDTTEELVSPGDRVRETLETSGDADWYQLELAEGETVRVTAYGQNHDRDNGVGRLADPVLRLYDVDSQTVAENDDIVPLLIRASSFAYTAAEAGTYYVEVASYQQGSAGDYVLNLRNSVSTPEYQATPLDAIAGDTQLNDTDTVLVYFAESGDSYDYGGETFVATGTNAFEQDQLYSIFEGIEAFADIDFAITTNKAAADLQIGTAVLPQVQGGTLLGFFLFPNSDGSGNYGFLNNNGNAFPVWNDTPGGTLDDGGFMYGVAIHEFGHAMGLGHPHDNGNGTGVMLGVDDALDRGSFDLNSMAYTAMSYNEGSTIAGVASNFASTGHGLTYGALDIAVLQEVYGTNTSHASGDDSYALWTSNATGSGAGYATIWDTGGDDAITYDGTADAVIDLRAATLQYETGGGGYLSYVDGVIGGYTIANGVQIEEASTGSGDDIVRGNALANTLFAGDGDDQVFGLAGDDLILADGGDDGEDSYNGGTGFDTVIYDDLSSSYNVSGSGGNYSVTHIGLGLVDTLVSIEELLFSDTFFV